MSDQLSDDLALREAIIGDADLLLNWRNERTTRMASNTSEPVLKDDHMNWLDGVISNPDRRLFIAEENGTPVGTARADQVDGIWELSWTVAKESRGRGVAKLMVALLAENLSGDLCAQIKKGNIASVRVAEYIGMQLESELDGILYFLRNDAA